MPAEAFFDTNVLIYAFSTDVRKAAAAQVLLAAGGRTSVQVFNEFANVCRRKLGLEWKEIDARIAALSALIDPPSPLTLQIHDGARALARDAGLSFYDALIVEAARQAGVETLYSEDMQNGRRFDRLVIRNPF